VSQRASKLRPMGSWGGLCCVVCASLLATPAAGWASTSTPFPGPDTPPASARYLPEPDAPPSAGRSVTPTLARTVRQPAATRLASQPSSRPRADAGSPASTLAASEQASGRPAQPVRSAPVTTAAKRPSPAASRPAVKASGPKAKPKPAAAKKSAAVALAARAPERLVPRDAPGRDRGLLVLAGVLLGVVAIGGAVLGEGYRHAFRERHP
jgi:hypothetical protein